MGEESKAEVVSMHINDGDKIEVDRLILDVIHTPGTRTIPIPSQWQIGSSPAIRC